MNTSLGRYNMEDYSSEDELYEHIKGKQLFSSASATHIHSKPIENKMQRSQSSFLATPHLENHKRIVRQSQYVKVAMRERKMSDSDRKELWPALRINTDAVVAKKTSSCHSPYRESTVTAIEGRQRQLGTFKLVYLVKNMHRNFLRSRFYLLCHNLIREENRLQRKKLRRLTNSCKTASANVLVHAMRRVLQTRISKLKASKFQRWYRQTAKVIVRTVEDENGHSKLVLKHVWMVFVLRQMAKRYLRGVLSIWRKSMVGASHVLHMESRFFEDARFDMQQKLEFKDALLDAVTKKLVRAENQINSLQTVSSESSAISAFMQHHETDDFPLTVPLLFVAYEQVLVQFEKIFNAYAQLGEGFTVKPTMSVQGLVGLFQRCLVFVFSTQTLMQKVSALPQFSSSSHVDFKAFLGACSCMIQTETHSLIEIESRKKRKQFWKKLLTAPCTKDLSHNAIFSPTHDLGLLDLVEVEAQEAEKRINSPQHPHFARTSAPRDAWQTISPQSNSTSASNDPIVQQVFHFQASALRALFDELCSQHFLDVKSSISYFIRVRIVPELLSKDQVNRLFRSSLEGSSKSSMTYDIFLDFVFACAMHLGTRRCDTSREKLLTMLTYMGVLHHEFCFLGDKHEYVLWTLFKHYANNDTGNRPFAITMNHKSLAIFLADMDTSVHLDAKNVNKLYDFESFCIAIGWHQCQKNGSTSYKSMGDAVSSWIKSNMQ